MQQGTLYHVGNTPSLVLSSSSSTITRVALSLGDNKLHRLAINDSSQIKKEGSVPLPGNAVSLSFNYKDRIVVSLETGSIAIVTWDALFNYNGNSPATNQSRKRKRDTVSISSQSDDIFTELLRSSQSPCDDESSCITEVARIPSSGCTLLSGKFFGNILGAFYITSSSSNHFNELCLILWKQSRSPDTVIAIDSTPLTIISHKHNETLSTDPSVTTPTPPSLMVTCTSCTSCTTGTVISDCLYSYLFGHEDLIVKSPVIIYGCVCGCVLAISLKRISSDSSCQPKMICSFDQQSVVSSLHTYSLGPSTNATHNSLICIGSNGGAIVFIAHESNVIQRQFFISPQVISSILVNDMGLVYSSIDTVQKICLRQQCCASLTSTNDGSVDIFHVFNTPLVVIESPLFLLCIDRGLVLGVTMDGRLVYQELYSHTPCVSVTTPTSAAVVGESVKNSLLSLQSSTEVIRQIHHDISKVDEALIALNETMVLFKRLGTGSDSAPLMIRSEITYEQNGVYQYSPHLVVSLSYIECRPLRRGVALIIEVRCCSDKRVESFVKARLSKEDEMSVFTQMVDLQSLQSGCGELRLKPKIPFYFYESLRLNISFYCVYNPQVHKPLETELVRNNLQYRLGMVKICQQNLSPLHFLFPVKNIRSKKPEPRSSRAPISLNISIDSLSAITGCPPDTPNPSEPLDCQLLSGVLVDSEHLKNVMKESIVHVRHGIGGGRGLELRAVCYTDLLLVQLHWNVTHNHFILTIDSLNRELALILADETAQRILTTKCAQEQSTDYLSLIIRKSCISPFSSDQEQIQEAIIEYFHNTKL